MAEVQGLIINLEARTAQLERGLKRANDAQRKAAGQMERRAKQSADKIAKTYEGAGGRISAAFKTVAMPKIAGLAGAAAGIGLVGGVAAVRQTVRSIAEVGDAAKRAGMQVEAFQEWGFVAEQNRISVDALTDGFKEMALRADEFIVTGAGSAGEAFKRLGFSAVELQDKLKDPSALMVELVKRMERLDKAAQIRIADELFGGTGGEQFVQLLDKGAAGISEQIARARDLGIVMDSDMIAKAAELDAKFAEVETRLQTMWRTGVVEAGYYFGLIERERAKLTFDKDLTSRVVGDDVATALAGLPEVPQTALAGIEAMKREYVELASEARRLVPALSDASSMLRGVGNEAGATALTDLATRIGNAARAFEDGAITGEEYADRLKEVVTEAQNSISAMGELDQARLGGVIDQVSSLLDWLNLLPGAAAAARAEINSIALMDTGTPLTGSGYDLLPPGPGSVTTSLRPKRPDMDSYGDWEASRNRPAGGGGGGGGGGRSQDEFAQALEAMNRERLALEAEAAALIVASQAGMEYADAIEFARVRADLLLAAQRDGKAITPELTAEIDRLAQAHVRAGSAAQKAADDLQAVEERGRKGAEALGDVFTSVLTGAKTAEEAVADLLLEIAKIQFQKAMMGLFGDTGLGGVVGGLLGFSEGGYTGKGGKYQPAGIVHANEYVFSSEAVKRLGAGNLDAMHRAAKEGRMGYASGGLVDAPGKAHKGRWWPSYGLCGGGRACGDDQRPGDGERERRNSGTERRSGRAGGGTNRTHVPGAGAVRTYETDATGRDASLMDPRKGERAQARDLTGEGLDHPEEGHGRNLHVTHIIFKNIPENVYTYGQFSSIHSPGFRLVNPSRSLVRNGQISSIHIFGSKSSNGHFSSIDGFTRISDSAMFRQSLSYEVAYVLYAETSR